MLNAVLRQQQGLNWKLANDDSSIMRAELVTIEKVKTVVKTMRDNNSMNTFVAL